MNWLACILTAVAVDNGECLKDNDFFIGWGFQSELSKIWKIINFNLRN